MSEKSKKNQSDIEWENRTLCIDESCIGVIGPDGRCKECGKAYEGENQQIIDADAISTEIDADTEFDADHDVDWKNRTLCIDESCIGVIGPDGKCKECGKPYKADN